MNELKTFGLDPDRVQVGRSPHHLADFKLYVTMRGDVDDWKRAADAPLEDQLGLRAIREARRHGDDAHKVPWLHAHS